MDLREEMLIRQALTEIAKSDNDVQHWVNIDLIDPGLGDQHYARTSKSTNLLQRALGDLP